MLYEQQVLSEQYSLAPGKETLTAASFLLAAGPPLNYYLDNISLEEIKPFDHLLVLGMGVGIQFISFWLVKEIIDGCLHLLRAETDGSRKQQETVNKLCI